MVRPKQLDDYTVPHGFTMAATGPKHNEPKHNEPKHREIVIGNRKKSSGALPHASWADRLRYFERRLDQIVGTIRELVEIESPSHDKHALDRIAALLAQKLQKLGGRIDFHRSDRFGDSLQADFPATHSNSGNRKPALLLGHFDTVYPIGALAEMPCAIKKNRLSGPGVLDMKSGVALMLHAIEALQVWNGGLPRPVTVFLVSDEEIGSRSSRKITESLAKKSAGVLVLEPAAGIAGAVKTARKGVGEYKLGVKGIAAHAGLDPSKGHSAILELARQIAFLAEVNNLQQGITVNPGVIEGGTRTNVIAAAASVGIDVRIKNAKQASSIDRRLRSLKPFDKHCKLELTGGINRLPMERTGGVAALYSKARSIAAQVGWELGEASVGGGSDGNFTAAMGVPTLDGLGGVGDGAHAAHEYILIPELPRRAMLLAGMIEAI
jgi:glutamate carboxypeptidase